MCRKAWKALGELPTEAAQVEIMKLLEEACPELKEAVLNDYNREQQQAEERSVV